MKKRKRLIRHLYPPYLALILLSLIAVSWYTSKSVHHFFIERSRAELETSALIFEGQLHQSVFPEKTEQLDNLCKNIGKDTDTRITVILPNGQVAADSDEDPRHMDNHGHRPEILEALQGVTGTSIRYSKTLNRNMMYLALPLKQNGRVTAVVRTSIPLTDVENEIRSLQLKIGFFGFIIALVATGVCLLLSRRISRPIENMTKGAERFAKGDLKHRLPAPDTLELATLVGALNQMAQELENRMEIVINQRNEYKAVLTSMVEGVIAIDMEERILSINRAAAGMLALESLEIKGRSIIEAVRNSELHQFITEALEGGRPKEGDVVMHQIGDKVMHTQCIPLNNAVGERMGTLVVLHDVTRIRRLENIRRDFVANVSHEIKTPLTAIKGFIETLQHGDAESPEEQKKFLGIIKKHSDRLDAIIEDLLALARLEQREEQEELACDLQPLEEIVETAIQVVKKKAEEKQIHIETAVDRTLQVYANAPLMEQAIVNLLDNAVKYSPEGNPVYVKAETTDQEIQIHIIDQGSGISKKHQPRLFERFYRVDRARSRMLGGTGLGLAIVKHIAQAHGGSVLLESTLGKGSTFSILLPRKTTLQMDGTSKVEGE